MTDCIFSTSNSASVASSIPLETLILCRYSAPHSGEQDTSCHRNILPFLIVLQASYDAPHTLHTIFTLVILVVLPWLIRRLQHSQLHLLRILCMSIRSCRHRCHMLQQETLLQMSVLSGCHPYRNQSFR